MGRAWVLNLDADLELAAGAAPYAPSRTVLQAMEPWTLRLAASLLAPGDVLVTEATPPGAAAGLQGRAFCPTPRAIALLVRAGATPEPHPAAEVLRRVNDRVFCAELGQTLPGAAFVRDEAAAYAILSRPPEIAAAWRAKRAFGMAGRGQRKIAPGALDEGDRAFLRAGRREGGIQIEPNVAIVRELALHGLVDERGHVRLGSLVAQRCDAHGQWLESFAIDAPREDAGAAIEREALDAGAALHAAGYFGPFGIDAFVYTDLVGGERLQPRSEINARYSMGWAVGFSSR